MIQPKNKVVDYDGIGLMFENNGFDRPRIQDTGNKEFMVHGLKQDIVVLHADEIDDLIILLQEVKAHGYKIDY